MTHASLCTGIGSSELAATWMGWNNAFSCEINEFCQRVLKYHYPSSKHYENIFGTDFSGWRGKIDILTAGFPCQPFSCAGSRKGAEDYRYLWPEVLRVIGEVRPTWFIGENVAGITSVVLAGEEITVGSYKDIFGESYQETEMRQQFIVERICRDLEGIGYTVQPLIIPACAVGTPHRRDRIWFIANTHYDGSFTSQVRQCNRKGNDANQAGAHKIKQSAGCCRAAIASNPTIPGFQNRFSPERWAHEKENRAGMDNKPKRHGKKWFVADTNQLTDNLSGFCPGKISQPQPSGIFGNIPSWENFPAQSPVCCGDDGFPSGLSGITFSKHRQESIKALGNAMVPQVVYQIFKAIKNTEETF